MANRRVFPFVSVALAIPAALALSLRGAKAAPVAEVILSFGDEGGEYPATDLVMDAAGNLYLTGVIGPDHSAPVTQGCPTAGPAAGAFVAKISPDRQVRWLRRFEGNAYGVSLALSPDGSRLAVAGIFSGALDAGATSLASDPELGHSFVLLMTTS